MLKEQCNTIVCDQETIDAISETLVLNNKIRYLSIDKMSDTESIYQIVIRLYDHDVWSLDNFLANFKEKKSTLDELKELDKEIKALQYGLRDSESDFIISLTDDFDIFFVQATYHVSDPDKQVKKVAYEGLRLISKFLKRFHKLNGLCHKLGLEIKDVADEIKKRTATLELKLKSGVTISLVKTSRGYFQLNTKNNSLKVNKAHLLDLDRIFQKIPWQTHVSFGKRIDPIHISCEDLSKICDWIRQQEAKNGNN